MSLFETEPAYQVGVQTTGRRTTPDVAYNAAERPGFAVYQGGSWQTVGGTSAGAPQWAGLVALADQAAGHDLGPVNAVLYRLAASASPYGGLRDITGGAIVGPLPTKPTSCADRRQISLPK